MNRFLHSEAEEILKRKQGVYGLSEDYVRSMIRKCRDANDDVSLALWCRINFLRKTHRMTWGR